ncbi:MAG: LysR family transcriptional regulator [Kofleriaceae bacterium]
MDLFAKMATYVRVVEAGTLSAAAKQLRVSGAAVSRQIATLEELVGTALIARTTRKMTVTPAGQAYYERCVKILRDVDDAQAIGTPMDGGLLRISAPVTFGLESVMPKLRAFARAHPEIRLDLRLDDRVIDLVLEGVDVAIRVASLPPVSTEIIAHRLTEFQRVIVAAPSYVRKHGRPKTPAALASHVTLSHAGDGSQRVWNLVGPDGGTARVPLDVRAASNAGHVLRDLACDGAGIALLPQWFVADDIASKRLEILLPGWSNAPVQVHALFRTHHRGDPRVKLLLDHLRTSYAGADH